MEHSRENLEIHAHVNNGRTPVPEENRGTYTPRPKYQIVLAWIGVAIVLFGFLGTCYWMVNY